MGFDVWPSVGSGAAPSELATPLQRQPWLHGGSRGRHRRPRRTIVQMIKGVPPFPRRLLKYDGAGQPLMQGIDIELWQRQARRRGYLLKPDGCYGPRSCKVAKSLQERAGLMADGVIDPRTWVATWQ